MDKILNHKPWSFSVKLMDETVWNCQEVRYGNTGWGQMEFSYPIKNVSLSIENNQCIYMSGFSEYNFFIEDLCECGSMLPSKTIYLMGNIPNTSSVDLWKLSFQENKIYHDRLKRGKEWSNSKTIGWKTGKSAKQIKSGILINGIGQYNIHHTSK